MKKYAKEIIIGFLIVYGLVATISAVKGWFGKSPELQKASYVPPQVNKAVEKAPTKIITPKAVKVYQKEKIIDNLPLSKEIKKEIKENPNIEITDTAKIDCNKKKSGTDVTATFNTATGETTLLATDRPLKFAEFLDDKEIGTRMGFSSVKGLSVDLFGRWTFGRVGPLHAALYVEGSSSIQGTKPEAKAMAEISYRW
jgi:hypothetical protein